MANVAILHNLMGITPAFLFQGLGMGNVLSESAEAIVLELSNGNVVTIEGTNLVFNHSDYNPFMSGSVTAVSVESPDYGPIISITDLSLDANAFGAVVVAGPDDFETPINIMRFLLSGDDTVVGGDANDVIYAGMGDDSVDAGAGADFIYVGPGAATIDGGEGEDWVNFAEDFAGYPQYDAGVSIDLSAGTGTNQDGSVIVISNVENVIGSLGNDTIVGDDADNILEGSAGDDSISGGGGNDMLFGGEGNDTLDGGDGDDLFEIGEGMFTYYGGDKLLIGGEGEDVANLNGPLSDYNFAFNGDGNLVFTNKVSGGSYTLSGIEYITDGITSHTVEDFRQVSIASQQISEDGVWSFALPEGAYREGTTFTVTDLNDNQLPAWISFDVETRTFTGTPPADWNGNLGIKLTANDHGIEKVSTFNLEVTAVNDGPTSLTISGGKILENSFAGKLVGVLHAKDADGDALTYSLVDDAGGRFRIDGNKIVVADGTKLDYEQAKSHNVTVKVADKSGAFTTETFAIEVGDVSNEKVTGGTGNDVVKGGSGKDKIAGGLGKDVLTGGKGQDAFVFNTKASKANVDKITDFNVKDDSIHLDNKYFAKLGSKGSEKSPAKLNKDFFTIGSKAKDKDDYLVYDNKKGVLYYDADGSGKGKAVEVATLSKNLKMTAADFFVI